MNQRNGVQATYEALKAQIKNSGKILIQIV